MKFSRSLRTTLYSFFLLCSLWLVCGIPASLSAQNINIPDANFKQALIDAGIDTGMDGEISQAEAGAVTNLDVSGKSISDLTGISFFANLEFLHCDQNSMSSLNVSALINLRYLDCYQNSLTSIDVNGLSKLEVLICADNSLTSLDVSGLTNLIHLNCADNSLTSLNVKGLTILLYINCIRNELTSLDVSGLTLLMELFCFENSLYSIDIRNTPNLDFFDARFNPDLECILVDDVNNLPTDRYVDQGDNIFTTKPCFGRFEGLPILVNSVGLSNATEAALLATLKVAERACTAGNKRMTLSSLTTFALMVSRAQQLGRLTAAEAGQLKEAAGILKDDIQSGQMDCSSGTPPNILDWISSWFSLDAAGDNTAPDAGTTVTVHPGSQGIHVSPELRIYPNPTAGRVEFFRIVDQVEVYNMVGQLITQAQHTSHLDLHEYLGGVYVIRLIDDSGERSVHRVVKK